MLEAQLAVPRSGSGSGAGAGMGQIADSLTIFPTATSTSC